jgi:hypothetical protein
MKNVFFSDAMSGLSDKIDKILSEWRERGIAAAFVKLSTRSPKDVTVYGMTLFYSALRPPTQTHCPQSSIFSDFDNAALQQLVLDEITRDSDHPTDNEIVWGFIRATSRGLKVSSGKEALDVRLLSLPEQCAIDIYIYLSFLHSY